MANILWKVKYFYKLFHFLEIQVLIILGLENEFYIYIIEVLCYLINSFLNCSNNTSIIIIY